MRSYKGLTIAVALGFLFSLVATAAASPSSVQTIDDAKLKALTTTIGGARVLPTTQTVTHWWGSTLDPNNGVTYGYNMVGVDPSTNASSTIEVDITPVVVNIDGLTFSGNDVLAATLASPQFQTEDYGATPFATAAGSFPNTPAFIRGPGGVLSQDDAGKALQLQDATMRAQFNKTGASGYPCGCTRTSSLRSHWTSPTAQACCSKVAAASFSRTSTTPGGVRRSKH